MLIDRFLKAVEEGRVEDAGKALEEGCDVNSRGPDGLTALMLAVRNEDCPMASLLLSNGADAEACSGEEMTVVEHALLKCRFPDMFTLLRKYGAVPDQESLDAHFRDACSWFPVDMRKLETLLSLGADPDSRLFGPPALHRAVLQHDGKGRKRDNRPLVRFLLGKGVDPMSLDGEGRSALDKAQEDNGDKEIIDLLTGKMKQPVFRT